MRPPRAGIEALNVFPGSACIELAELAAARGLDAARFDNLLMRQKTVALPHEDPVTFAANAARPLVDGLDAGEKDRIEMLITCSESGIDFGKSLSTYVHQYLGLNRNCRLFEIKQACYSGTAGFQTALNAVLAQVSPGAKALVVATDISRFVMASGSDALTQDWAFTEPSSGAGAVALLVGEEPAVFQADVGANGYYGYEVMDTCRPEPDSEAGNADLSLLSYLDCCEQSFAEYARRVAGADYRESFHQLAFHVPFGGMVKGAHRTMLRKLKRATAADIESDFQARVLPGLRHAQRVGNIMGGSLFMSLASIVDHAADGAPLRVGCFSYGSGCCSEFFSGVVPAGARELQRRFRIGDQLDARHRLSMDEYARVLADSGQVRFGTRNVRLPEQPLAPQLTGARLVLREIAEFHRRYEWVS
ncbi:MAG: hydroxymethylglutaryl-CoA synthase family protein [Polaromonas sp.]|nr:hydroxymethylglutaryl-CoA synthase family protein [Polaromonas sp.]